MGGPKLQFPGLSFSFLSPPSGEGPTTVTKTSPPARGWTRRAKPDFLATAKAAQQVLHALVASLEREATPRGHTRSCSHDTGSSPRSPVAQLTAQLAVGVRAGVSTRYGIPSPMKSVLRRINANPS